MNPQLSFESLIDGRLEEVVEIAATRRIAPEALRKRPLDVLEYVGHMLAADASFERTEDLEWVFKAALWAAFSNGVGPQEARQIAHVQARLGFVMKYKSYAVKAASPLGYSVFLQEPSEGFSIQLHADHKVEVFHILDVKPGAFVLLAEEEEWNAIAGSEAVDRLLATGDTSELGHVAYVPRPGDIVVVREPGIVHTVVGCVLEEFATASTDMVVRLHDQNAGRGVPRHFTREDASKRLAQLAVPEGARVVQREDGVWTAKPIEPQHHEVGSELQLGGVGLMSGARLEIAAGARARMPSDPRAASLFVLEGEGALGIPTLKDDPAPLALRSGLLTLIAPDTPYEIEASEGGSVSLSSHQVPIADAFSEQLGR